MSHGGDESSKRFSQWHIYEKQRDEGGGGGREIKITTYFDCGCWWYEVANEDCRGGCWDLRWFYVVVAVVVVFVEA
jgi:hypothetical protein